MKKIFTLVFLAFLSTGWGFSQSIQLIMSPRPSCYFSDWQNKTETIRMIVNNTSKAPIDCKIKTQLFNSKEEMVGETDFNKMPVLSLQPGISQFNAEDIYPLDAIKLFGNSLSSMLKTGRIPEDNYRICTDLLDPVKGTPLTQSPQCKMFSIIAFQAPVLLTPREDEIIPETGIRAVMFRWTPVTPSSNVLVTYRFQVWEVLDGQTKADACRYNQPIVEKDFRGILQTQWPVDFALPGVVVSDAIGSATSASERDKGDKLPNSVVNKLMYVWSVTPYDDQDRKLVIEGYGMAEPFGFSIKHIDNGTIVNDDITVELQQPPRNQLSLDDLWNFKLTNLTNDPIPVSLSGTISVVAGAVITGVARIIVEGTSSSFSLPPGTIHFTVGDTETPAELGPIKYSSDEWRQAFERNGNAPAGDYTLCVSVLDKEGKEIGKGSVNQKITGGDACKDFKVNMVQRNKEDNGGCYDISITNNYRGIVADRPKSFRITANNANEPSIGGNTRTSKVIPPGTEAPVEPPVNVIK